VVKGNIQSLEDIKFVPTKTVLMSKVVFDENNPNVMSDEKHEAFDKVITKHGFAKDPWLNERKDGTYLVIDGEQGIRRMQAHNVKKFQAKIFHVTYAEVRILRQIANKLHGEHDKNKDAEEFKGIFDNKKLNEFAQMLGEPIESFQEILKKKFDISFGKEEQEIPEPPVKPKSKLGDIYQLGNHRVMCGDSTKDIKKLLDGVDIDLLLTDPPYGVDYTNKSKMLNKLDGGNRIEKDITGDKELNYLEFYTEFLKLIPFAKVSSMYIFQVHKGLKTMLSVFENLDIKLSAILVWNKNNHVLGRNDYQIKHEFIVYGWKHSHKFYGGFQTSVLDFDKPLANKLHPTMKPIELLSQLIKNSTKKNMIVYDPFLGSGSTLIACEQTNRVCYGMELDPAYVDVIVQRWENFTGKKAKLETSLK